MKRKNNNLTFFTAAVFMSAILITFSTTTCSAEGRSQNNKSQGNAEKDLQLMGNRFFTFATIVRVNQIEVSRDRNEGVDESAIHTPDGARLFRQTIEKCWPEARITWAFSWLALQDQRQNYKDLRDLVVSYHKKYGDEITFIPGAYFSPMYNSREQTNRDMHEGLQMVSEMVGGGYRPLAVIGGFRKFSGYQYWWKIKGNW
jgi:hypothetical protein